MIYLPLIRRIFFFLNKAPTVEGVGAKFKENEEIPSMSRETFLKIFIGPEVLFHQTVYEIRRLDIYSVLVTAL